MNNKLNITIDVTKIPKEKITERKWESNGKTGTAKELKLVAVPLKDTKKISEGDTWELWKTHFIAVEQTKEERENKVKSTILGDGVQFISKNQEDVSQETTQDDEEIPF